MDQPHLSRFLRKLNQTDECWLWTGHKTRNGYGQFRHLGKTRYIHRLSYEHFIGPIPDGFQVQHLCNVRHCGNPKHLTVGPHSENMAYAADCGRMRRPDGGVTWTRGSGNGRSKLTEEQVLAIRADTRPNSAIASEYGISYNMVYMIRTRRRWSHITEESRREWLET